ncbi:MAG: IS110 family transposase [Cyanobacteria bacterium J06642_12]
MNEFASSFQRRGGMLQMEVMQEEQWVGIDVSQATLDIAIRPGNECWQESNQSAGWSQLSRRLSQFPVKRVVLESTGGLERGIVQHLQRAGFAVTVINPKRGRDFAKACGRLAKTDRIDAQVLAHFAEAIQPDPQPAASEFQQALSDLVHRRQQVVEIINTEKRRLHSVRNRTAKADIEAHIDWLKQRLKALDKQIDQHRQDCDTCQTNYELLTTVPGVGRVVATVLLARLPELGQLHHKQLASLVGVAPFNQDSGKTRGRRRIVGGRAMVRSALYLSALVAVQHNSVIRAFYQKLLAAGKAKKLALIACAHKLLTILNAILKHQQPWRDCSTTT